MHPFRRLTSALLVFIALLPALTRAQSAWAVSHTNLPNVSSATSVAFGNGRFVAALATASSGPSAAWSTDGLTWTASSLASAGNGSVLFVAGSFYLAGGNTLYRSTDGDTWTTVFHPSDGRNLFGLATDGRALLVGSGTIPSAPYTLYYSADRVTFRETAALPGSAINQSNTLLNAGYVNGRYFVNIMSVLPGGNGATPTYTTTDEGATWTLSTSLVNTMLLATGNGRLVADGTSPAGIYACATSTDGTTFTFTHVDPFLRGVGSMGFAGGRFFYLGSLSASTDGVTWAALATVPAPGPAGRGLLAIAYGNGRFVAVGSEGTGERNAAGQFTSRDAILSLMAPAPPVISTGPLERSAPEGSATTFSVVAQDSTSSGLTYQWFRNGSAIAGATNATYTLNSVTLADAGLYSVTVRNSLGATTSDAAALTVTARSRISNVSVLTSLSTADDNFTLGYVVGGLSGSANKPLLIRAAGPSLAPLGVAGPLEDPKLELFSGSASAGGNDNWGGSSALAALQVSVGAFPFVTPTSKDAAFSLLATARVNSVKISSANAGTGVVLAEVYDATPPASFTPATPRLINVSVLKQIGNGFTMGFSIAGTVPKSVLIRAVGPTLGAAPFNVSGTATDPRLTLFNGSSVKLDENDNWGGSVPLNTAFTNVGAFGLVNNASKDAALLTVLPPGSYSVQVSGVGGSIGVVLVELYEIP
jgi:hypothetical protein